MSGSRLPILKPEELIKALEKELTEGIPTSGTNLYHPKGRFIS